MVKVRDGALCVDVDLRDCVPCDVLSGGGHYLGLKLEYHFAPLGDSKHQWIREISRVVTKDIFEPIVVTTSSPEPVSRHTFEFVYEYVSAKIVAMDYIKHGKPLHYRLSKEIEAEARKQIEADERTPNEAKRKWATLRPLSELRFGPDPGPFAQYRDPIRSIPKRRSVASDPAPTTIPSIKEVVSSELLTNSQNGSEVSNWFNPSTEAISLLLLKLVQFLESFSHCKISGKDQEFNILPRFAALSDAIDTIRNTSGGIRGWTRRLPSTFPEIAEAFDSLVDDWGWQNLDVPETDRIHFVKLRQSEYYNEFERPRYEAAISWQEGEVGPIPADDDAERGRKLGLVKTMDSEAGKLEYLRLSALIGSRDFVILGTKYPRLTQDTYDKLCQCSNTLRDQMLKSGLSPNCDDTWRVNGEPLPPENDVAKNGIDHSKVEAEIPVESKANDERDSLSEAQRKIVDSPTGINADGETSRKSQDHKVKQKRKGGRPKATPKDIREDKQIDEAWKSGHYQTHRDLAEEFRKTEDDIRKALDRHRHRENPKAN